MKKLMLLLLALLLLSACAAPAAGPTETPSAVSKETAAPAAQEPSEETAAPEETKTETEGEEQDMSSRRATLDGLDSYLRLTLPEGWSAVEDYMQSGQKCLLLVPPTNDGFTIRVVCWDSFGMCGTGVSTAEETLPNGMTVTIATEESSDGIVWKTVILPAKSDQFTLQMYAQSAIFAEHQAEIDEILASLKLGELSHIPPQPLNPTVDK